MYDYSLSAFLLSINMVNSSSYCICIVGSVHIWKTLYVHCTYYILLEHKLDKNCRLSIYGVSDAWYTLHWYSITRFWVSFFNFQVWLKMLIQIATWFGLRLLNRLELVLLDAKYFGVFSFISLKMREICISFAQFVYFLREVCSLFNFWMIKFTITFFLT